MTLAAQVSAARSGHNPEIWAAISAAAAKAFQPPPTETVSDWADKHRMVGDPSPWKGLWRTSRTPYLREIMDVCSPSHPAREIDVMKPTQIGLTEAALNVVGYYSHRWPQLGMIVLPDRGIATEWADLRFVALFEGSPDLSPLLIEGANRKNRARNAKLSKRLTNGATWKFAWSSNGKVLSSTPAPILIADEVDRWYLKCGKEGEPVDLLRNRFSNFPQGKYFRLSSPVDEASSRIAKGFLAGDQRYFFVPCPNCNWFQRLVWAQLKWPDGGPESRIQRCSEAKYQCIKCGTGIEEWRKTDIFNAAKWVSTQFTPELRGAGFDSGDLKLMSATFEAMGQAIHPSFHMTALVAPLGWPDQSWRSLAAYSEAVQDNPEKLKNFVMTKLAEPWAEKADTPDEDKLFARRDDYESGVAPVECCFLTAFVDVQSDRVEYEVVGWDDTRGRWSISYETIKGDPQQPAIWAELQVLLNRNVPTADGNEMPILAMGIDTGFIPAKVYEFARANRQIEKTGWGHEVRAPRTVVCTKGDSTIRQWDKLIVRVTTDDGVIRKRGGVPLVFTGPGYAKRNLFPVLKMEMASDGETYPHGFYHYPSNYGHDYFVGVCSEELIVDGLGKIRARKIDGRRNEILDLTIGNWAVAEMCVGGFGNVKAEALRALRNRLLVHKSAATQGPARPAGRRVVKSSYLSSLGR